MHEVSQTYFIRIWILKAPVNSLDYFCTSLDSHFCGPILWVRWSLLIHGNLVAFKHFRDTGAAAAKFVEAATGGEDDESKLSVAENGELASLLDEAGSALREGHLPAALVFDSLYLHFPAPHFINQLIILSRLRARRKASGGERRRSWEAEDEAENGLKSCTTQRNAALRLCV